MRFLLLDKNFLIFEFLDSSQRSQNESSRHSSRVGQIESSQVGNRVESEEFIRVESESSQNCEKSAKSSQVTESSRVEPNPWIDPKIHW